MKGYAAVRKKKGIKRIILGDPLTNQQLSGEKLSRLWGLPIMASDAVSSVAYAVEEILRALLLPLGMLSVQYVGWVSFPIILLLLILVFSYSQIIKHYPEGGGAYVVSKESFGNKMALLAAACLIIDYAMTVAVSISSAAAAAVAVFPGLESYKILISVVCIAVITLLNLRGVGESSKIFGIPTYIFIFSMVSMIVAGLFKVFTGSLGAIIYEDTVISEINAVQKYSGITLLLYLKAFSSGCSALTGVEAVSNAIPSFKEPSQKTANHVLYMLGGIIIFIFGGTSILAGVLKVVPLEGTTVISQMASAVFGNGIMYYVIQFTTSLILLLAANTAYNGLPNLLSILAGDHYMPHQFSHRGTKLSFSNGIMFISFITLLLVICFKADTHRLIPFYSVGVFVSFTLSQAGIFTRWLKNKEKGWQYKAAINGFGAIVTLVGTVVVFSTKFMDGAWMLLVAIPAIMIFMGVTKRHYEMFANEISLEGYHYKYVKSQSNSDMPCIVLIHNVNRAMLKTFEYAGQVFSDITVVHIFSDINRARKVEEQWEQLGIDIPLTILEAPDRDVIQTLNEYITKRESEIKDDQSLTVVLTKFVGNGWRDALFHNQTAFFIENKLEKHWRVVTVLIPYLYHDQGFTLVEMITTLSVMGIITVTGIPILMGFIDKADRQAALAECRNAVQTAMIAEITGELEDADALDIIKDESKVKGEVCMVEWLESGEIGCLIYKKNDITVTYLAGSQAGVTDMEPGYHIEADTPAF